MLQAIFHGHSFVELILANQTSILIDPFMSGNPKCELSLDDIANKQVTAICITHGHGDHVGDTLAIKGFFPDIPVYTVTGVAHYLEEQGLTNIHGGSIGGTLHDPAFSVKLVNAIHDGNILDTGKSTRPSGMIIKADGKTIYHMGDTALSKDFELIGEYENIDLAFVPIGDHYTMGTDDALIACKMIKAHTIVPIHYNTRPKIKADDMEFARQVMLNKYAVPKVLKPGQAVVLE